MIKFRRSIGEIGQLKFDSDLDDFLAHYVRDKGTGRHLTQVVTLLNGEFSRMLSKRAPRGQVAPPAVPPGFPWVTVVLGSGSVDTGLREGGAPLRRRVARIRELLNVGNRLPDGLRRGELAGRFAEALIRERIGQDWDPDEPSSEPNDQVEPLDAATGQLILAVALLTRLHHEAMATLMAPVPRWEDEQGLPIDVDLRRWPELELALADPAREVLGSLVDSAELADPVVALLEERIGELTGRQVVSLASLRLLTECCWYYLVRGCLTQPGWSDLMLDLTMEFDPPIPHQDGRARPLYESVSRPAEQLAEQYRDVTKASWSARLQQGEDRRPTLHDQVAAVLRRQAALQGRNPGPGTVPLASAFVTGFDLELELALIADRQSFVLALPAFVEMTDRPEEVSVVWLGRVVDVTDSPGAGELPIFQAGSWLLLSGASQFGRTEAHHRHLPVVVRLTGCPAIALPDLAEDPILRRHVVEMVGGVVGALPTHGHEAPASRLHPAFVLDEYVAGVLGATESFLDHVDNARLGLPRWITGTPGGVNAQFARFWLVLGSQLSDSSIRQRVVAHLTSPALNAPAPDIRPARTGLIVNRRLGRLDCRLMQWHGFDIVEDHCEALSHHLEHYTAHLDNVDVRCDPEKRCKLQGTRV
jgi:hypothetical protein